MTDRTQNTMNNIARGVEVGALALGLLERIISLFRPKPPDVKAKNLRDRAETKRGDAAKAKSPNRRKRLLKRAGELDTKADKISRVKLIEPVANLDADTTPED